jgi:predicted lipoprotein
VRPLGTDNAAAQNNAVNPAAYVESMWASKLLPAMTAAAADAAGSGVKAPRGASYWVVKGEGRVLSVNTESRVGLALVDVAPFDGRPDVSIEIGPVLRGTGLRDVTGLVHFSDFVNQLQFADVANELNDRVLKSVLPPVNIGGLKGRTISFEGVAPAPEGTPRIHDLVPVRLAIVEAARR